MIPVPDNTHIIHDIPVKSPQKAASDRSRGVFQMLRFLEFRFFFVEQKKSVRLSMEEKNRNALIFGGT